MNEGDGDDEDKDLNTTIITAKRTGGASASAEETKVPTTMATQIT